MQPCIHTGSISFPAAEVGVETDAKIGYTWISKKISVGPRSLHDSAEDISH